MTKLPIISAKDLEKVLYHLGFEKMRQKGSHAFYRHSDGRTTTVPHHPGHDISRPLVRSILREINLEISDFNRVLDEI